MFNRVIQGVSQNLRPTDLGRVVLHHPNLDSPIVVPLRPLYRLNSEVVMEVIERTLNSNEDLDVRKDFDIDVGTIRLPRGGAGNGLDIVSLTGENNSIKMKKSMVEIVNSDTLCMSRAIAVSWGKTCIVDTENWKVLTQKDSIKDTVELVLKYLKMPLWFYKKLKDKKRMEQKRLAEKMCDKAGVSKTRELTINDLPKFEGILGVSIAVISADMGNKFMRVCSTENCDQLKRPYIYLYHIAKPDGSGHFHAITKISGFFSMAYFCETCMKPYHHPNRHRCLTVCNICKRNECFVIKTIVCQDCNMACRSKSCYESHKEKITPKDKKGEAKSQCDKWWKCKDCTKVMKRLHRTPEQHKCGEVYCNTCERFAEEQQHLCYHRASKPSDTSKFKYIMFDFECSQDDIIECVNGYKNLENKRCKQCVTDENQCLSCRLCLNCFQTTCGLPAHCPNYVVAQKTCNKCELEPIEEGCGNCGNRCEYCSVIDQTNKCFKRRPCSNGICGSREICFEGNDTALKFGRYVFDRQHKGITLIAHNMKGYDGYFILEYLLSQSIHPNSITYNGSKIMYMHIAKGLNIRVIDSLNFFPMKLSALPKAFGLSQLKKGWFPHFFNRRENQKYIGPFPPPEDFGYDFMSVKERDDFQQWYSKQNGVFHFRKEMKAYCISDVTILREACMKFRRLMIEVTKSDAGAIDPFQHVTIASVCMCIFKTKYLAEEHVAFLENDITNQTKSVQAIYKDGRWLYNMGEGLVSNVNESEDWNVTNTTFVRSPIAVSPVNGYHRNQYSNISIAWLEWLKHTKKLPIQHALNVGEHKVVGTNYRLDGYVSPSFNSGTPLALEFMGCLWHLHDKCYKDVHLLKTGQTQKELHALIEKKRKYLEQSGYEYIQIWECEFHDQIKTNSELKSFVQNLDIVCRLNPRDAFFGGRTNACQLHYKIKDTERIKYVDFTSLYPYVNKYCSYPVGHPEIIVRPNTTDIFKYFGIAQVKILPPRCLYHPVLPYRSAGKLKFPLCKTCADNESQNKCLCSDDLRMLIGTWCTPEIAKAVEMGYKIMQIYEVYNWKKHSKYDVNSKSGGLFTDYVNSLLKLKQQASGWPDWCQSPSDKSRYIQSYFEREGVKLEADKIEKNPGLRALAKLCLNSFWGKFGQRNNMTQTKFFHESEAESFFSLLSDPTKEVLDFQIATPSIIQTKYANVKGCEKPSNRTNVFIAAMTTSWARLRLFDVLHSVQDRALYYDTDSVIYISRFGAFDPPLGDFLGDLSDELENDHIVEFISAGPKNYGYRTFNGKEVCKVRGFTLNFKNSQLINFESVKNIVLNDGGSIYTCNPNKICRSNTNYQIYSREEKKKYGMVYNKRILLSDFNTLPYGY